MAKKLPYEDLKNLPACAHDFINLVIRKMRYRRKVRRDVQAELAAHFEDGLRDCKTNEEKEQKAQRLIEEFGDAKLLGVLLRRAKKRCRPLWKRTIIRSLQAAGILLVYLIARGVFLTVGTPIIRVDYLAWLNELVSEGKDEALNARPYFEKAVQLSGNECPEFLNKCGLDWPGDMNEAERQAVAKLLDESAESLDVLRQGVEKPYYWWGYPGESEFVKGSALNKAPYLLHGKIWEDMYQFLGGCRNVARGLALQVSWKAYKGDVEGALSDCVVLQKFGSHFQGKRLLSEQTVGIALEALGCGRTLAVLEKVDASTDVLRSFQEALDKEYDKHKAAANLEAEKAFWYDFIQRTFTDDGEGSGRVLADGLPLVMGDWKGGLFGFVFLNYPDRREVRATIDRYFEQAGELFEKTPWELHSEGRETEKWDEIANECFLLRILGPAHSTLGELIWRLKTDRAALLTVLAALRHKKEKGEYPQRLEDLVKVGYLKELPIDPYSDGPLVYRSTADRFVLYSVGPNFKDDGGKVDREGDSKVKTCRKRWADEGDTVFWPAVK